ncbi:DUF4259 domain-containing protein [Streptomyces virginiae]|uniref:DUF4259 domain-containing protein n=1 Tax=Streptomyces virginiae TaxID=1961 RepID=UPI00369E1E67
MGTWDIGPFDNDTAADFAGDLGEAALEERKAMIQGVLKRAAGACGLPGYLRRRACSGRSRPGRRPAS